MRGDDHTASLISSLCSSVSWLIGSRLSRSSRSCSRRSRSRSCRWASRCCCAVDAPNAPARARSGSLPRAPLKGRAGNVGWAEEDAMGGTGG